jgi:hypothetical protein
MAIIGAVILPILSIFIIYQYFRHRSWFFWAAVVGVLMETIGFICRAVSSCDEHKNIPFLIAFLFILLAPSFLAAACYTAFSRVVWFSCPAHALSFKTLWCYPRYITPTFVIFDLISFLIQLVGGGLISYSYNHDTSSSRTIEGTEAKLYSGRIILVLGLILQMLCFLSFAIIALRYFVISRAWRAYDLGDFHLWRKMSWMINAAATLITLRAIYRTLEIPHDRNSGLKYLQSHEWCFWVFDALPITLVLVAFAAWHPGRYLPRSYTAWRLDKGKAVAEKDSIGVGGVEMRDGSEGGVKEYRPQDFRGKNGELGMRV